MAAKLGVNYIWDAPDKKDNAKQIDVLNKAVSNGADLIMIAANDPVSISAAIEDAKAKSVKIIYVDLPAYEQAIITLSTNNYEAGITAGKTILTELENVGFTSGFIGIIGVNTTTESTTSRERGFRKQLLRMEGLHSLPLNIKMVIRSFPR